MEANNKKWYDNKLLTHFLLLIFLPIGLYALWKSRTIAKWWKILVTILSGVIVLSIIIQDVTNQSNQPDSNPESEYEISRVDPLGIGIDSLNRLVGDSVPYQNWSEWGFPKTLDGTNNNYWVGYLNKANISIVSEKKTDLVIFAGFGENSGIEFINKVVSDRKEMIESQFSTWDGSHRNLNRTIKELMDNPSSFEHIESVYFDRGNHLIVTTRFKGKNALGMSVENTIRAKVDDETGQIIEILEFN